MTLHSLQNYFINHVPRGDTFHNYRVIYDHKQNTMRNPLSVQTSGIKKQYQIQTMTCFV